MAGSYITGKEDWIAGDGFGFADTNRIEGNIDYIRNQISTFNGAKTFTNTLTVSGNIVSISGSAPRLFFTEDGSSNQWTLLSDADIFTIRKNGTSNTIMSFTDAEISTFNPVTMNSNNNRISFNSGGSKLLFGSGLFTSSSERYRINYADFTVAAVRFDTLNTDISHIWGSHNAGGTLLTQMVLDGAGHLNLNEDGESTASISWGTLGFVATKTDQFYISHIDNHNATDYGVRLTLTDTLINAKSEVKIRVLDDISNIATYTATTIELNRDTTVTQDLLVDGNINPTTTPTESATTTLVTDESTAIIPRGLWDVLLVTTGTVDTVDYVRVTLEKYISGGWEVVAFSDTRLSSPRETVANGLQSSTGLSSGAGALRIRFNLFGTGTGTGKAELSKN